MELEEIAVPGPLSAPGDPAGARRRGLLALFTATAFLSSFLLFLVQPLVARMLLPRLGGSAAVWNTAMVFFQAALLVGYLWAHVSLRRVPIAKHALVQLPLLALGLLVLPVAVPTGWEPPAGGQPALWTLAVLVVMVGLPFTVLSTTAPTLQRWFSTTDHPHAADPYFLYAAGNVGSFLALLAYPFVIEPALSVPAQSRMWSALYVGLVVLVGACAVARARTATRAAAGAGDAATVAADDGAEPPLDGTRPIDARRRAWWVLLAFIPSAYLLGVTHHVSTDVAAMPLLWVVPLSLYLLTFVIAFSSWGPTALRVSARAFRLLVVPLALSFIGLLGVLWLELGLNLAAFACAAMVCHARLAEDRPDASRLTEFYLWLSVGGVLGGIFAALVAPLVFTTVAEYPIAVVLTLAVTPVAIVAGRTHGTRPRAVAIALAAGAVALAVVATVIRSQGTQRALTTSMVVAAVVIAGGWALARTSRGYAAAVALVLALAVLVPANPTRFEERTFFGVHRVYDDTEGWRILLHGTTVHGLENLGPDGAPLGEPRTYYDRTGPIGSVFGALDTSAPALRVGAIGMGSGAVAAYGRAGDTFTFYEIDDAVVRIARDPSLFSFVPRSAATIDVVLGDGRLELQRNTDARYDLLVLDAFSSDSIPAHLMTREALALYRERLADGGVVAFHISNRYFDFRGVLGRLAADAGLLGAVFEDTAITPEQEREGKFASTWVVLARTPGDLERVTAGSDGWRPLGDGAGAPLWTDDYSNLLQVLR